VFDSATAKKGQTMAREDYVCDCDIIHADVVESVRRNMPEESELYDLSDFFKVLGDSTRSKIMWALDEHELCVCDLAALLKEYLLRSGGRPCAPDFRDGA
jgi:hypothetical protein